MCAQASLGDEISFSCQNRYNMQVSQGQETTIPRQRPKAYTASSPIRIMGLLPYSNFSIIVRQRELNSRQSSRPVIHVNHCTTMRRSTGGVKLPSGTFRSHLEFVYQSSSQVYASNPTRLLAYICIACRLR